MSVQFTPSAPAQLKSNQVSSPSLLFSGKLTQVKDIVDVLEVKQQVKAETKAKAKERRRKEINAKIFPDDVLLTYTLVDKSGEEHTVALTTRALLMEFNTGDSYSRPLEYRLELSEEQREVFYNQRDLLKEVGLLSRDLVSIDSHRMVYVHRLTRKGEDFLGIDSRSLIQKIVDRLF